MIITGASNEIAAAYIKARSEISTVMTKDGKGHNSNYVTLASILDEITPILNRHGLAILQEPLYSEAGIAIATTILHTSGATIEFQPLPMPYGDGKPQAVGSGISYARRYALTAVRGLAGEDDDGQAAQAAYKPAKPVPAAQNGYSHQDDVLWEPNEKPKKSDAITPAQLTRLTILVTDFYGAEAKEQEV